MDRRNFLLAGGAGVVGAMALSPGAVTASSPTAAKLRFSGDGLSLAPTDYVKQLAELAEHADFEADVYANGGIIAELESRFAALLGKETAVFLPTGTLANHIALRRLCDEDSRRAIVPADSHIYNDSGDCAQALSGLALTAVQGEYSAESVEAAITRAGGGRVKRGVGAVLLESPLRRSYNSSHTPDEAARIAEVARRHGAGAHLDGARLFMQAAHCDFSPADYTEPFDTVYISLYKNFNACGGAILAGRADTLADLLHERRMFGGSPCHVWPMAAVALHYADGFIESYRAGRQVADEVFNRLGADRRFRFERIPSGTNGLWLHLEGVDPADFVSRLGDRGIAMIPPRPQWPGLLLMINPTLAGADAADIAAEFLRAAGD